MGRRDTLLLSILTVVTSLGWIAFDFYHATVDSTIPTEVEEQLIPITPRFDRVLIDKLKTRQDIEPLTQDANSVRKAGTQQVSTASSATKTATPSAGL